MEKKQKNNTIIYVLIAIVLISWIIISTSIFLTESNWDEKNNIFNSINSFLSTLVLMGTVYAIYMQRIELELQRKELANSSKSQSFMAEIELHKFMASDKEIAKVYFHGMEKDVDNYNVYIFANLLAKNLFHEFENDYMSLEEIKYMYKDSFAYKDGFLSKYWKALIKNSSVQERVKKYKEGKENLTKFDIYQGAITEIYYDSLEKKSDN